MINDIIDAHCHIYPDAIALKAVAAVENFYPTLPGDHHDGTVGTLISSGAECGITHFIVHSVATTPVQVDSIDRFIARSVEESGGAFTGLGTMHPDVEDVAASMESKAALGLKGVKIHPDIQRFPADDKRIMPMYEICEAWGWPVLVHTGDYRYDFSNPNRIKNILQTFPKLNFVGAHFGGWSIWEKASAELSVFDNITVDTCSSLQWLGKEKIKKLIEIWGEDRVMFATDYPLWQQKDEIDLLLECGLSEDAYRKIFRDNAVRIYSV